MDQKDIKKRDLMDFDKFAKSYDKASKLVMLKSGQNGHPGTNPIKGEDCYVRNDANIYDAAGIPYNKEQANVNPREANANQVDVYHNGKIPADDKKKIEDAATQVVVNHQMATILDEAASEDSKEFNPEDLEKTIKKEEK